MATKCLKLAGLLVVTLKSAVWEQNCVWLFYHFNFERHYDVLKPKSSWILLNKNINFNKHETHWKIKTLCFSSYKNRKLKVKLLWVGARERKKRAFFVQFILSYLNAQWTEYTFRIYRLLLIKKYYLYTFLLVFKIGGSLQCILKLLLKNSLSLWTSYTYSITINWGI